MTPTILWSIFVIAATAASLIAGVVLARLLCYRQKPNPAAEAPEFSLSRYAPMSRLLSREDEAFLSGLSGVTRKQQAAFRAQRRQVFREYLAELATDFQALHLRARSIAAHAPEEHADLLPLLFQSQLRFWRAMAYMEWQMALDSVGLRGVETKGLLDIVDTLRAAIAGPAQPIAIG